MNESTRNQNSTKARARTASEPHRDSVTALDAPSLVSRSRGAPPSNTAPTNDISSHTSIIRSGIDSLYPSWSGVLFEDIDLQLEALKEKAQSEDATIQAQAVFNLLDHHFEVGDKARGKFAFNIKDNWFDIKLSRPSAKSIPLAVVKINSELLTVSGFKAPVRWAQNIVSRLGEPIEQKVSRVDLCVDFVTDYDLSKISTDDWVTRARDIDYRTSGGQFTGFTIGYGGKVKCRLYNKTLEIKKSNKTYLYPLWAECGWEGEYPVWRLEFEIHRPVLKELGIFSTDNFDSHLNGLWQHLIQKWLRLTIPNPTDSRKARWPIHPVWQTLAGARFGDGQVSPLSRVRKERFPSEEFLFVNGLGAITSFMAQEGISSLAVAINEYIQHASVYHRGRPKSNNSLGHYVHRKVSEKRRKFNSRPAPTLKDLSGKEYRKAKEGE
jgi:hypothetical protein